MGHRAWYEGSSDPLDNAVDVGRENQYEPDQVADPREPIRKAIANLAEFSVYDPEQIMLECEQQDEMLGMAKGTALSLFLESVKITH